MTQPSHKPKPDQAISSRVMAEGRGIDLGGRTLRQHAARGVLITGAFQVGLAGVGLARRFLVAAFLTQTEYGLWGLLIATLVTLVSLKQLGIADKYIQQNEDDQEAAYHRAFTLELALSLAFFALVVAALPAYAAIYGRPELILPGVILATTVPITAFQTPIWIAQRRMQFVRQRALTAVDPVVSFVVTVAFGILGFGYWCLVIGGVAGATAGAVVALTASPAYRPKIRFERSVLKEYTSFSLPLLGFAVSNMIIVQGTLIVAEKSAGLAAIGAIGLASTVASFTDRVDRIVSQTIYPAACAVADRTALLREAFVKSNRIALMWAIPFSVGLALFSGDLITFVLGERWRSAQGLFAGVALILGLTQVAFNWDIFLRAVNQTKPIFIGALSNLALFFVVSVPTILIWGLDGYLIGLAATVVAQLFLRAYFLRRLFGDFAMLRHLVRAIGPVIPATLVVLAMRATISLDRTIPIALGELSVFIATTILVTLVLERALVREMIGYAVGNRSGLFARSALEAPEG